ncbi:Uncharacterized protein HSRCO_1273 [Halanaeroarchaeum sp. HSR-CO]|uniref:hypothetical protein n=1 Tax=Halanaeroarchaeum sp. HSR-CO TaxID=2866382 RepID=UPI00217E2153|nr:hypothetical protein [Halanaeroarchaeum sp. HSR-CO]UWG47557.1 Uncharacterized protein HSRCO_1273 [Halanaeroarchaeum sp. HSR-CO]
MIDRRSVIRTTVALVTGSALAGTASSASSQAETDDIFPYDAGREVGAATTIGVRVDPGVANAIPQKDPFHSRLSMLEQRFESVTLESLGLARGSLAVEGERVVGGGATIDGEFQKASFETDIEAASFEYIGRSSPSEPRNYAYYQARRHPYAIGVDDSTVVLGFGDTSDQALSHAKAVNSTTSTKTTDAHNAMARSLGTTSLATASLGDQTRSALRNRLPDGATRTQSLLETATQFGCGIDVDGDRSNLRYGVEFDPDVMSIETIMDLASQSADRTSALDLESIERDGWTVIIEASSPTSAIWEVHEALLGIKFE